MGEVGGGVGIYPFSNSPFMGQDAGVLCPTYTA